MLLPGPFTWWLGRLPVLFVLFLLKAKENSAAGSACSSVSFNTHAYDPEDLWGIRMLYSMSEKLYNCSPRVLTKTMSSMAQNHSSFETRFSMQQGPSESNCLTLNTTRDRLNSSLPKDIHVLMPKTCECYLKWQNRVCSDYFMNLEMGKVFWMIQLGPKAIMYLYKKGAEDWHV